MVLAADKLEVLGGEGKVQLAALGSRSRSSTTAVGVAMVPETRRENKRMEAENMLLESCG